jgi:hypothetical protein
MYDTPHATTHTHTHKRALALIFVLQVKAEKELNAESEVKLEVAVVIITSSVTCHERLPVMHEVYRLMAPFIPSLLGRLKTRTKARKKVAAVVKIIISTYSVVISSPTYSIYFFSLFVYTYTSRYTHTLHACNWGIQF